MSKVYINEEYVCDGEMSIEQVQQGDNVIINGLLEMNLYLPDIQTIRTNDFYLLNVNVIKEALGTVAPTVIYTFEAEKLKINIEGLNQRLLGIPEEKEGEEDGE